MILVADSGSTKCDWALIDPNGGVQLHSTAGFNPYFHSSEFVTSSLDEETFVKQHAAKVGNVFFYGAGCSSPEMNQIIYKGLKNVFAGAEIAVEHDVLGAALASCQGREGIACILGTGSNSCYFDGAKTQEILPSLGFVLGDEGSGSWFGRLLLRDYLYNVSMPQELRAELASQGHDKDSILNATLRQPNVNTYLASFMKTLSKYKQTDYGHGLISAGLTSFLERHVCCFENYRDLQSNFVGSVAYYHKEILEEVAQSVGVTIGNVLQKPIDGLVQYHQET